MVLWEIALGTAYFLGLKRTYRLACRLQRRLIGPNHPKTRHFLQRRTRNVFDVALKVHQNIQQRDIEARRNLGNWIPRWLERVKQSAHIHGKPPRKPSNHVDRQMLKPIESLGTFRLNSKIIDQESYGRLLFSPTSMLQKSFPTIAKMKRPSSILQYRHIYSTPIISNSNNVASGFECVFWKDARNWMLQN